MSRMQTLLNSDKYDLYIDNTINSTFIIGHFTGNDKPSVIYNDELLLQEILAAYGVDGVNEISVEKFDELAEKHIKRIIELINAIIARMQHAGDTTNEWGSIDMLRENAHDRSVNISVKQGYDRLVEKNNATPDTYKIVNILAYYNEELMKINHEIMSYNLTLKNANILLEHCDKIMKDGTGEKSPIYDELIAKFTEYKEIIARGRRRIESEEITNDYNNLLSVIRVIEYMETHNAYMVNINDHEVSVLLHVWKRIHAPCNAEMRETMLHNLTVGLKGLKDASRPDEIICVNGRVGAIISAIDSADTENIFRLKSVPMIRIYMMQCRAPFYINETVAEAKQKFGKLYDEYATLEQDADIPTNLKIIHRYIRETVTKKLTDEFKDQLLESTFKEFLNQILAEL